MSQYVYFACILVKFPSCHLFFIEIVFEMKIARNFLATTHLINNFFHYIHVKYYNLIRILEKHDI